MRYLFIHQNFPGQFRHLAPALQRAGHEVLALGVQGPGLPGVPMQRYRLPATAALLQAHTVAEQQLGLRLSPQRLQIELVQAEAAFVALLQLQAQGYTPDVVLAHPGWGEALFVREVWPRTRLLTYAEFYFDPQAKHHGFDTEWEGAPDVWARARLRLRNHVHLQALSVADGAWCPTHWQHSVLPSDFAHKVQVVFDGVDTERVKPAHDVSLRMHSGVQLRQGDEVLTFINRNLEPARGFHTFMRALPRILRERPQARAVIVGGNEVSYGGPPPPHSGHSSWREHMLAELALAGEQLPLERVHFMGKIPYAAYVQLLQLSACHVYLSTPFVLGWSCFEAMSAGALVVGSATAPVQELIAHGRNGLLVDFFDAQALAAQVVEVLAQPGRFQDLRTQARHTIAQGPYALSHCLPRQLQIVGA